MKKTLIIGASQNPERYANKAYLMLKSFGHQTLLLGNKVGEIGTDSIVDNWSDLELDGVDAVTLYLGAKHQLEYYDKIVKLKPNRVIFNPGTENEEFYRLLRTNDIAFEEACTLVLLQTGQY